MSYPARCGRLPSLVALAALAILTPAHAAKLTGNISELTPRPRRTAPEWVEVSINSDATGVREGALEFTMFEYNSESYRYRTHDIAINTGVQKFRFLLPAASASGWNTDRKLQLEFVEKDRKQPVPLGTFPLLSAQGTARAQVIAVVRSPLRAGADVRPFWQTFRLERFAPKEGAVIGAQLLVDTAPVFFDPSDLPADPLGFTPFDVVLIEPDAMRSIRGRSRDALGQWVAAGGSLCVVTESGIDSEHVDWLNGLVKSDPEWKPLEMDGAGHVRVPENFAFGRADYGRVLVAAEPPRDEAAQDSKEWRRACAYLWKLRFDQAISVTGTGSWSSPVDPVTPRHAGDPRFRSRSVNERPGLREDVLMQFLTPGSVRVVPMPAVFLVLGLFVVIIGPGDWFLLGLIRRRRWTWVLFPLAAVAATGVTVMLARHYTGTSGTESGITITDLGADGRVVRETQIGYELPAAERLRQWSATASLRWTICAGVYRNVEELPIGERRFDGQFPARYQVTSPMRQWVPILTRTTMLGRGSADASGVDWNAIDPKKVKHDPLRGGSRLLNPRAIEMGLKGAMMGSAIPTDMDMIVRNATITRPVGFGEVFSQISPNGFSQFDDLLCLDESDTSRDVLVAIKRDGNQTHIWRRLYLH